MKRKKWKKNNQSRWYNRKIQTIEIETNANKPNNPKSKNSNDTVRRPPKWICCKALPKSANMETNLQSNEVRIPKSPQSPGVCPQFKSTFARSLSFNTNTQPTNKPLDLEISFRIAQNVDHSQNLNGSSSMTPQSHKIEDIDEDFEEFMRNSPLKQSMQNLSGKSTTLTTPTRQNAVASRAYNTTCSGRHRFQVRTLTTRQMHFFFSLSLSRSVSLPWKDCAFY